MATKIVRPAPASADGYTTKRLDEAPFIAGAIEAIADIIVAEPAEALIAEVPAYLRELRTALRERHIPPNDIDDLLQRAVLLTIKKVRTVGLDDPSNIGGYLYRTATNLAIAQYRLERERAVLFARKKRLLLPDDVIQPDEALAREQEAGGVREVLARLLPRDREALARVYLREESHPEARAAMQLAELQFNNVFWRARKRFAAAYEREVLSCSF